MIAADKNVIYDDVMSIMDLLKQHKVGKSRFTAETCLRLRTPLVAPPHDTRTRKPHCHSGRRAGTAGAWLVLFVMIFSFSWKHVQPPAAAEVELWDSLPQPKVVTPPPAPEVKPEPPPPPEIKPEIKPEPKPEPPPEPKAEIQVKPKPVEVKKPPKQEPKKPDPAIKKQEDEKKRKDQLEKLKKSHAAGRA